MNHRVVVQCAGQAFRMPADAFLMEMTRCRELQQLVLCYVQILLTQMSQSIVCIGHHSVSERLSYWLLFNRDALGSDQLKVTHEMIANMLGVRRESVTQALGKLQSAGLVASGRGKINILDRDGLSDCVCECFSLVSSETQRLYERAGRTPEACFESDEACLQPVGQDHDLLHKYQDAYDFAPVGFVSLDRQGRVVHTNLAGAIMLDIQRSQHKLSPFQAFMKPSDQAAFLAYHQEVFSGRCRRYCEVTLCATDHRSEMVVRIDATLDEMGEECRLVMIDVTEDKKQMAQELARERQQQEWLAKQPFMLWFKDQDGHLISANSSLIEDWRHFAQDASLEKVDLQSMPVNFRGQNLQSSHSSSDELRSGAFKPS
jgi:PAS domain-containing protein